MKNKVVIEVRPPRGTVDRILCKIHPAVYVGVVFVIWVTTAYLLFTMECP
jgi:hypothetical protein